MKAGWRWNATVDNPKPGFRIVNVQATDQDTGQQTSTTISLSSGLSQTDLQESMRANRDTQLAGRDASSPGR